ncbi:MAG TPA: peptidoglycan-binding protein [Bacillota bacterium]|nr:peptidoglycan-binding protein [Bacillota bacterium]
MMEVIHIVKRINIIISMILAIFLIPSIVGATAHSDERGSASEDFDDHMEESTIDQGIQEIDGRQEDEPSTEVHDNRGSSMNGSADELDSHNEEAEEAIDTDAQSDDLEQESDEANRNDEKLEQELDPVNESDENHEQEPDESNRSNENIEQELDELDDLDDPIDQESDTENTDSIVEEPETEDADPSVEEQENQEEQATEEDESSTDSETSDEDREQSEEEKEDFTRDDEQETDRELEDSDAEPSTQDEDVDDVEKVEEQQTDSVSKRATLSKSSKSTTLKKGSHHQDLIDIKKMLNYSGYGGIKVTTYFGEFTEKRVKQFQEDHGLKITGEIDSQTRDTITHNFSSIYQKGGKHTNIKDLKRGLNRLGFDGIKVTDYFGSFTQKRVREFQDYYGLSVTGKANLDTLDHLTFTLSSPFQRGKRHEDTKELKQHLNKLGFGNIKVTTLFGSFMEKRMKDFQDYYGLKAHGIADSRTLEKLDEILSTPFQLGKRHDDTIKLKKKLNELGYSGIKETTLYGSFTEKRVKEFQADHNLPVSGIVDEKTLEALRNAEPAPIETTPDPNQEIIKIFLDPGHGGHDPGAKAHGLSEKDVVLDIALETARYLTRNYTGVEIKLSRTTDEFIPLEERAQMANRWGADYFVSLHNNSFDGSAHGFESYIYSGNVSNDTVEKQKQMHEYIANEIGVRDRGMKKANFSVLRNTQMPAILLEYLFIDHIDENNKLKKASYRKFLGEVTAKAIANAFGIN